LRSFILTLRSGANSPLGIGRASVHQFAQNGAKAIFLCDFQDDHLATHKRELNSLYPSVDIHTRQFDAANEAAVEKVVQEAVDKYGRLDVFFANAGVSSGTVFTETTVEQFMNVMRVNTLGYEQSNRLMLGMQMLILDSVFLAAKHAAKAMLKNKPYPSGSIVATASVAGIRSNAGGSDYSASKAAVVSLMQTISYQLAGSGIRCNAICPGIIETGMTAPMYATARSRGTERKIGQLNPLKRGGIADEVSRVVLFLASDDASYVNGQSIPVCGGLSAGHPFVPGKLA
jgi:NAD(P)-dependent dehydrogenase (short-subunit alcohol dehydrogenase family)